MIEWSFHATLRQWGSWVSSCQVTSLNVTHHESSTVSNSRFRTQHRPSLSLWVETAALICSRHWNWTLSFTTNTRYVRGCQEKGQSFLSSSSSFFLPSLYDYAKWIIFWVVNCGYHQYIYVNSVDLVRGPFTPLEQNNKAFAGMKGRGVSLPLHAHNKVPLETCDLRVSIDKICFPCFKKMLKMLSVGDICCSTLQNVLKNELKGGIRSRR